MAYTSCASYIADNIARDCSKPLSGGYTGRGVLIDLSKNPTITQSGTNPRIITAISLGTGIKCAVVDNTFGPQPFTGTNIQSNTDDGTLKYRKTVTIQIPLRGAEASKEIVEPLSQNPQGYLLILEKKDRNGDGSFEVVGFEQGLQANADGITRNEYENGGCTVATMSCNETWYETVLFDTDYATTLTAFNALVASAFT